MPDHPTLGAAGKLAKAFIDSKLTPLVIAASLLLGAFATLRTPREEEPQIVVPMLDVMVQMPGASAEEVQERVAVPMERLLREVPRVEYLYTISHSESVMIVVRFEVGTKEEDAIIQTYNKLYSNLDRIPPGVSQPIIKPRSIDDVPILALTLWGKGHDAYELRRVAAELKNAIKQVDDVSETNIIGGQERQVRVVLDTQRLAAYAVSPAAVAAQLERANNRAQAGTFASGNREFQVDAGRFLNSADDLRQVVVGVHEGHPVYLRDVAQQIIDGPEEPRDYVLFGKGAATTAGVATGDSPAVTITVSKRKATNATAVSRNVLRRVDEMKRNVIPADMQVTVTRNYGKTAKDQIRRTPGAPAHCNTLGNSAHSSRPGMARVRSRTRSDSGYSRADPGDLLLLRIYAEPRHAIRAHFLHRHSGRRRHCCRREHGAALPPSRELRTPTDARGDRSRR